MLEQDVDIVYIAVPHPNHFPCAKAALEAGKGILVEKPATLTAAESQILIDLAESKGLFFMEGVWTRFLPLAARFQELIHVEKAIGDIHHVFVDFGLAFYHLLPPQARHFNAQLAGGAQLDVGPYAILWVSKALSANKFRRMTVFHIYRLC
jgi:predicted dehydrogenase